MSRGRRSRRGMPWRGENPGGARPATGANPTCAGTDSRGEQSREVGQRHQDHFPRGGVWCAVGPAILGGGSATADERQDGMAAAKSCRGSSGGELPEG